jgi:hypothetical protein
VTPREEALMFWRALIEIWPAGQGLADQPSTARDVQAGRGEPGRDPQGRQSPHRGMDQHCVRRECGPQVGEGTRRSTVRRSTGGKVPMPSPFAIIYPGRQS